MVPTPMLRARALLVLPIALAAAGCEEEGGTETCSLSCDDGDFCTEDRCDPTLDRCVHVPRDAANACTLDRHCDDGDPCTTDSCGLDPLCGLQRCVHEFVPGCRSCAFASCDDGNACTTDTCGSDLLCRYAEQEFCDERCRMWTASFYQPSNVALGAVSVWGRVEPRSGASCIEGCACSADLVLTDGAGLVRLMPGESAGDFSCAISGVCDGPTVVACDPLDRGREYIVWGTADANRDAAGAAPIPNSDTSAQVDVGVPWTPADHVTVDGFCMAPTLQGVAGRYDATLELDNDSPVTFGMTLGSDGSLIVDASSVTDAQSSGYEAWNGVSVGFYFTVKSTRTVRVDLFPSEDRLTGWVVDPNQPATEDKPGGGAQIPAEPPPPEQLGARVGKLTLVLVP